MLDAINHTCAGYSHLVADKPCQDASYAESTPWLSMAIVSDGHGGERYFRSDRGSKSLVDITADAIRRFVELGGGLGGIRLMTSDTTKRSEPLCGVVHEKLRWLLGYIIAQWNEAVEHDAVHRPLTDWEKEHVDTKYLAEFEQAETHEKTYGCTLMAYFQTSTYWIAFQIGDGKLLTMSIAEGKPVFDQPVPWDDRCFLNKTTSICDSDAISEFRYCYCSDGTFPGAVFLGSDGLDDTYGDGALLEDFYMNAYLEIAKGKDKALSVLQSDLPEISRLGSKDDMSIAVVYDEADTVEVALLILEHQIQRNSEKRKEVELRISELNRKAMALEDINPSDPERIQLEYAKKDIAKLTAQHQSLAARRCKLIGRKGYYTRLFKETRSKEHATLKNEN